MHSRAHLHTHSATHAHIFSDLNAQQKVEVVILSLSVCWFEEVAVTSYLEYFLNYHSE